MCQGISGITHHHQKLGRGKERSCQRLRGSMDLRHLAFGLRPAQQRDRRFVAPSHPVCDNLLRRPREACTRVVLCGRKCGMPHSLPGGAQTYRKVKVPCSRSCSVFLLLSQLWEPTGRGGEVRFSGHLLVKCAGAKLMVSQAQASKTTWPVAGCMSPSGPRIFS